MSAADITETTLKKLLDNVEKTREHRQDQNKKKKKLLTEVERLKRGRDNHTMAVVQSAQILERLHKRLYRNYFKQKMEPNSRILLESH